MPLSVRLDSETDTLVRRLAKRSARTKSDVIRDALRLLAERESRKERARTPYEAMSHLIGCTNSGGKHLSERTGERFKALLRERSRAGRSR